MPNPVVNRRLIKPLAGPSFSPAVSGWAARVVANGGSTPSVSTLMAVDTWYQGLVADGLDPLIINATFFAPDSLIAARTPFYKIAGNDPWTISNAGGGATISAAGYSIPFNSGNTQVLNTGCNGVTVFLSTDAGMSLYSAQPASWGGVLGFFDGSHQCSFLNQNGAFNGGFDVSFNLGGTPGFSGGAYGFASWSRTDATHIAGWWANGVVPFASATLNNAGMFSTTPANGNMELNRLGAGQTGANRDTVYSFAAIHHKMTSAQTQKLFNRIQTLRQAFGGGFT